VPAIEEVKTYALDLKGALVPYTTDHVGDDIVLAVKITGTTPGATLPLTFTATKVPVMPASAYAYQGRKPPPKTKVKFSRKIQIASRLPGDPDSVWVLLPIDLACFEGSQVELGTSKKSVSFEGSCAT
jgi:hypothetical protein